MKLKSFTLIEIIVVIVIIWLIASWISTMFKMKEKDSIYSQACLASVYWELSNYVDNAITWKGIYTWSNWQTPDSYIISLDPSTDKVSLLYSWASSWSWLYQSFLLNWSWNDSKYKCYWDNYYVDLSWQSYNLSIIKWLNWDINNSSFNINSWTIFTWDVDFLFCQKPSNCKILWKLHMDNRSYTIWLNKCLNWWSWWTICAKWSQ